jgi:hypothetical protein
VDTCLTCCRFHLVKLQPFFSSRHPAAAFADAGKTKNQESVTFFRRDLTFPLFVFLSIRIPRAVPVGRVGVLFFGV